MPCDFAFPSACSIFCYCLSVFVYGRKPTGTEDLSKQSEESPMKSDQDDNRWWTTGSRRLGPPYDKFGFEAGVQVASKGGNRRSLCVETSSRFAIGEIGTRIVPMRAVCNLLRSLCDRYARTLKIVWRTLWTSRIWTIDR